MMKPLIYIMVFIILGGTVPALAGNYSARSPVSELQKPKPPPAPKKLKKPPKPKKPKKQKAPKPVKKPKPPPRPPW